MFFRYIPNYLPSDGTIARDVLATGVDGVSDQVNEVDEVDEI